MPDKVNGNPKPSPRSQVASGASIAFAPPMKGRFAGFVPILLACCSGPAAEQVGGSQGTGDGDGDGDAASSPSTATGGTVFSPFPKAGPYPEPYPEPECDLGPTTSSLETYTKRLFGCHTKARTDRLATITTAEQVYERQGYVRGRMLAEIGGFPERTPLNVRVVKTTMRTGYKIENIIYESQPGFFVTANLYIPTTGKGPYPAVLSVAGHGKTGKAGGPRYLANRFANHGFVVLAYDPPGQGERVDITNSLLTWDEHGGGTEHTFYGMLAELAGQNFARHEVWDGIRGIDYLFSRPEVDQSKGVGITGCSGGGTQSAFMAAFDTRVSAAAPACYMTRWPEYNGLYIDSEQAWPDFLRDGLNYADYPLAMAAQPGAPPRAFKILQGATDYFPIAGARATAAEAKSLFELIDKEDQFDFFEHVCADGDPDCGDGHGWNAPMQREGYDWIDKWLLGGPADTVSSNNSDYANVLGCTSTGQVGTAPEIKEMCQESGVAGSCPKTVHTMTLELAQKLHAERTITTATTPEQVRQIINARLRMKPRTGTPTVVKTTEYARSGYREEHLTIETEPSFTVSAILLVPSAPAPSGNFPTVLYVDRLAGSRALQDGQELAKAGHAVLIVEPRGSDLEPHRLVRGIASGADYKRNVLLSLVGKRLVGLRATDVLRSFDYLISRTEVNADQISIFGRDKGGITALHAGVLEPRLRAVASENALLSYMNFVETKEHHGFADLVIPGVIEDYDLPDLADAASPRPVWIVSPRRADTTLAKPSPDAEPASKGTPATLAQAQATYTTGHPASVKVLMRGADSSFLATYQSWLAP